MPVKQNKILIKSLYFCTAKHLSTCLISDTCLGSINICLWFYFAELRPLKLVQATFIYFFNPEQETHINVFHISLKILLNLNIYRYSYNFIGLPVLAVINSIEDAPA